MRRLALLILPLLLVVVAGCTVTHPRSSRDLDSILAGKKRIAIVRPQLTVNLKYIATDQFVKSRKQAATMETQLSIALRRFLEKQGHQTLHDVELQSMTSDGVQEVRLLNNRLLGVMQEVMEDDPDYSQEYIGVDTSGRKILPAEMRGKFDLLVAAQGTVYLETKKEYQKRWIRNVTLNILTFPFSLISTLIPVPMPVNLTISTSIFERSPDKVFLSLVVIDCNTQSVVYLNDFTERAAPWEEDEFADIAAELLSAFERDND